ncbi:MAG: prefoldin subunit [Euryarchaeota archaeon]
MELGQQLQLVVAEVQAARQQVASLSTQLREIEGTIVAVKNQPEGMSLHRQMGTILVEVEDRDKLISDLESALEQLNTALISIKQKEQQLVATYDELKESIEG